MLGYIPILDMKSSMSQGTNCEANSGLWSVVRIHLPCSTEPRFQPHEQLLQAAILRNYSLQTQTALSSLFSWPITCLVPHMHPLTSNLSDPRSSTPQKEFFQLRSTSIHFLSPEPNIWQETTSWRMSLQFKREFNLSCWGRHSCRRPQLVILCLQSKVEGVQDRTLGLTNF